jgi:hypothetical protein
MGDHQRAVHCHYDDRGAERIEAVAPALGQIDFGDSAVQPMRRVNGEVCGTESSQTPRWREMDSNFQCRGLGELGSHPAAGLRAQPGRRGCASAVEYQL